LNDSNLQTKSIKFSGKGIHRFATHEAQHNFLLAVALQRLTSGAAPVELRSPSGAPGIAVSSFFIGCLLEQEIYIISVSKKTGAAIGKVLINRTILSTLVNSYSSTSA